MPNPRNLHRRMRTVQGVIATLTGVVTIVGAAYSVYRFMLPSNDTGTVEALIQDGDSDRPVAGASVEILGGGNALVVALEADRNGRVSQALKEGRYNVRVKRDGYSEVTRPIQVTTGQRVDLTIRLAPPTAVKGLGDTLKKKILGGR